MTTAELIKKVQKIASKFLEVRSISFETRFELDDMEESMCITIFYRKGEIESNLSATVYSFNDKKYSVNCLLKKVEVELEVFNDKAIKSIEVNI